MALAIILLWTSPMPIGLTPGRLSRGINLHATKALRWSGLTQVVHKRFPTLARAEQRSLEDLKELQSLLQAWASRPDRPAAPLVFRAAFRRPGTEATFGLRWRPLPRPYVDEWRSLHTQSPQHASALPNPVFFTRKP